MALFHRQKINFEALGAALTRCRDDMLKFERLPLLHDMGFQRFHGGFDLSKWRTARQIDVDAKTPARGAREIFIRENLIEKQMQANPEYPCCEDDDEPSVAQRPTNRRAVELGEPRLQRRCRSINTMEHAAAQQGHERQSHP